ncbi:MAG: hypothetical protein Q8M95_14410 [Candidatus Methanoperedens sp.]|nr:hypothetical protein [Candidatus Methanoperedens sp.]
MVYFEGNLLIDQVQGHHNMLEQLVHNYAGLLVVFASIVGVLIIYKNFRGSKIAWPSIMAGMVAAGFIGLGDSVEHLLTGISPLPHESLHYLHMIGGPVALLLLYIGLREYTATTEIKPLSGFKLTLILLATILIPVALATQAHMRWDPEIEGPFLLVTSVPTIILSMLLLLKSRASFEEHSTVVLNISFVAVAVTLLTISLLFARMGDVELLNNAEIYVNGHAFADIMHAATATTLLSFGISTEGLVRSM